MMTSSEIESYLNRIGIQDIQPPTLSYLTQLHEAHVASIPWSTIDIVAGKPAPIDLHESVRLMLTNRSGYCFHLNGAFSVLLRSLGFQVSLHRAGVQSMGQDPHVNSFHLGLTIRLTDEQQREQRYIVDVGLGDMPYGPLPLRSGTYEQGPFHYQVERSRVAPGGWRLVHDPLAAFAGVDYAPEELKDLEEFKAKHDFLSRSPESPWIKLFLVRHRHATGSNELRGCIWNRRELDKLESTELRTKSQWLEVLGDVFHEHLIHYSKLERDDLWKRVWSYHEEWKRTKMSS